MKVVCPNCKKTYSINANLFLDKEQNIKCISCKHQWTEIFIDKLSVENNPSLEESSAIQKVPLTNVQVLKILREEAEFDKKIMKISRRNKKQKQKQKQTQKKNDVIELRELNKSEEINFLNILLNKEFWLGFCLSAVLLILLFGIYIYGELLGDIFPYLSDHLLKYLNFVDSIRVKIDLTKNDLLDAIGRFLNF